MQITTVDFYGDQLLGVRDDSGHVVIPLKPIVSALSLNLVWAGATDQTRPGFE